METIKVRVPFSDISYEYSFIAREFEAGMRGLINASKLVLSEELERLEDELAGYLGREYVVGVGSGTDALFLSLIAAGIGPGEEVITAGNICVAVMEAIVRTGALPVFVDITPHSFSLDQKQVLEAINDQTRAVIVVHPYGMPAEMDMLKDEIRDELMIIEACGQAFGARIQGKPVGSFGQVGCFSFNPDKVIGGLGDGGAVATDDCQLALQIKKLRDHGRLGIGSKADRVGFSSRLDAVNALAVRLKLKHIDDWIDIRNQKVSLYQQQLKKTGLQFQRIPEDRTSSYQILVALTDGNRMQMHKELKSKGIMTDFHYRVAPYQMPAFDCHSFRKEGRLQVTDKVISQVISLPFYTGITEEEIKEVGKNISSLDL